jgi:branched-chain amino acid transport system ATP-binding protein
VTDSPRLECKGLNAGYGKLSVARDIDFSVGRQEVMAVLGPNGAGKTTLLLTISGFLPPLGGTIRIDGEEARTGSARRMNRSGVVLVPDSRALFTELTPLQHLKQSTRRGGAEIDEVMELFPSLGRRARLRAADLSGGEQQMLALARALVQAPKLLLIDEMSMGLAPVIVETLMPLIRKVADQSKAAVVIVEQHVQLALEIADHAMVLVHGVVTASGPAEIIRRDTSTIESAYLSSVPAENGTRPSR